MSTYRKLKITLEKKGPMVSVPEILSSVLEVLRLFFFSFAFFYSFVPEGGNVTLKTQAIIKNQLSEITQQKACLGYAETRGCSAHSCMCSLLILKTANKLILLQLSSNLLLFLHLLLIHHSPLGKQYIFHILKVKIKNETKQM